MDVDDIAIGYAIIPIDGPGQVLGMAGPRYYRLRGKYDDNYNFHVQMKYIEVSSIFSAFYQC